MAKHLPILLVVCLVSGLTSTYVYAGQFAVEDFGHYVAFGENPVDLNGQVIPNGLDGNPAWGQRPPDTAVSGIVNWRGQNPSTANRVQPGNLDFDGLDESRGKRFLTDAGGTYVYAELDVAPTGVFDRAGLVVSNRIGKTGTTLYWSFLFNQNQTTTTNLTQNYVSLRLGTTNRISFGSFWNQQNFALQGGGTTVISPWDTEVHLVVLKIAFLSGVDSLSLWFDPRPGFPEQAQAPPVTRAIDMEFDNIYSKSQLNGGWYHDEWRFGTSFASVTPPDTFGQAIMVK